MKKDIKLEILLCEAGQMLAIGKDEIKKTLSARKNIFIIGIMAFFAFILAHEIAYGTLRYKGASISDFIQMGKFLK